MRQPHQAVALNTGLLALSLVFPQNILCLLCVQEPGHRGGMGQTSFLLRRCEVVGAIVNSV